MPDFGDEMGSNFLDLLKDARRYSSSGEGALQRLAEVFKAISGRSSQAGSMEQVKRAWDELSVPHEFTEGDPDNAKLLFSPVASDDGPGDDPGISRQITTAAPTEELGKDGEEPTRPLEGPEGAEGAERTEALAGETARPDGATAEKTAGAPGAVGAPDGKEGAEKGKALAAEADKAAARAVPDGDVPSTADDPRAQAERDQALGSLGPSSKGLSFEEQSAQCKAYAEAVQKELADQGVDSAVHQESNGAWSLEVAKCDVGRAADVARALRSEFPGEYANLRDFELQGAVMVPGLDEKSAHLVTEEATRRGMRAQVSRSPDGSCQVMVVGGDADSVGKAVEAAGVRVERGERSPLSKEAEEASREMRAKGVEPSRAPEGSTRRAARARSAQSPAQETKRIRERPRAPQQATKPIKTPTIGAR